jgi:hypothetical protein
MDNLLRSYLPGIRGRMFAQAGSSVIPATAPFGAGLTRTPRAVPRALWPWGNSTDGTWTSWSMTTATRGFCWAEVEASSRTIPCSTRG